MTDLAPPPPPAPKPTLAYWDATRSPWQSLLFLLPILVIYEAGTLAYRLIIGQLPAIKAESWLTWGFELFGIVEQAGDNLIALLMPPIVICVVLLSMQVAQKGKWHIRPTMWLGMWAESLVLAFPLFVLTAVMFRTDSAPAVMAWTESTREWLIGHGMDIWLAKLLWSLGAGLYEELVFRLFAIAMIHALIANMLGLKDPWGATIAIAASAVAFALYHFDADTAFTTGRFAFYTIAGVYLAGVYLLRGFGVAVGCHAVYDVIVVTIEWRQSLG